MAPARSWKTALARCPSVLRPEAAGIDVGGKGLFVPFLRIVPLSLYDIRNFTESLTNWPTG